MEKHVPIEATGRIAALKRTYADFKTIKYAKAKDIPNYREHNTGDNLLTLGYLEGWYAHNDLYPLRLRKSYAEAAELDAARAVIYDGELIAGQLYLPDYAPEEQARYDRLAQMFSDSLLDLSKQGARRDHLALDYGKLLNVGLDAIIAEIREKKAALALSEYDPSDLTLVEKDDFYECMLIELEALMRLAARYRETAQRMAQEAEGQRRRELERIAEAMANVPAKPARSFFEAVQSVNFFLSNLFGLYPLGRPDRYFAKFYEDDLARGAITRAEAQELVDCLCLNISCRVFSRAACGFIVGGSRADGSGFENDLTYMFLTALDHIRMADPNGALAVTPHTSDRLLTYAVDLIAKGCTHPAFYNDEAIVASLVRYGCDKADAVEFIHSTCAEITIAGKSKGYTTAAVLNLPDLLLKTVGENRDFSSFDDLTDAYCGRIAEVFRQSMRRYLGRILEAARNGNEAMRICALIDDCVERGKGLYDGGAKYSFIQPIFIGFATAVDSLEAIRRLVFEDKRLTLDAFYEIVKNDFEGHEALRRYIVNKLEHYGNDEKGIDALAAAFAKRLEDIVLRSGMPGEKHLMPGTFSYVLHATSGKWTGATFNGRRAGTSLSDGCCPSQGSDVNGPTALINSLTSWDQSRFLSGMVVNLKFSRSAFGPDKKALLCGLIRTFMEKGGLELQVNSVDRATLEDAKVHPERHGDLLVRIGGYSDYFVRLDPVLQREIIERTEY